MNGALAIRIYEEMNVYALKVFFDIVHSFFIYYLVF